jgi:hypothetical protein
MFVKLTQGERNIKLKERYCIKESLVWSCSVTAYSCKSESVKQLLEATPKGDQWSKQLYWLGKHMH